METTHSVASGREDIPIDWEKAGEYFPDREKKNQKPELGLRG